MASDNQRDYVIDLLSRRKFFSRLGMGAGAMALASLLAEQSAVAQSSIVNRQSSPVASRLPHFRPRASRVIYLFQNGGPSQVDLFDPKPELAKRQGERPGKGYINDVDEKKTGTWLSSPFKFNRCGQSGLELS